MLPVLSQMNCQIYPKEVEPQSAAQYKQLSRLAGAPNETAQVLELPESVCWFGKCNSKANRQTRKSLKIGGLRPSASPPVYTAGAVGIHRFTLSLSSTG